MTLSRGDRAKRFRAVPRRWQHGEVVAVEEFLAWWVPDGKRKPQRVRKSELLPEDESATTTGTIARPFTHERPIDRSKLPQQMTQAAGRGQPKRTGGVSERYRRWVRSLPCAWCGAAPPSEADHHPHRGMGGGKRDDLLVVPLCTVDHAHRTNTRRLGSMTPEDTERWMERRQIELLTAWIRGEIAA